jgi:MerR family transcriptional regulator, light-induced transcriptional regulator
MGKYSIKDLEKLSGIKAHTLRIWEQRFGILVPSRSDGNVRYYSDDELKKILKIGFLNQLGLKISKLAQLSDQEIANKVTEFSKNSTSYTVHIDNLIFAMIEMDENKFEIELTACIDKVGFEECFTNIIHPFFTKVGILWLTGNINPVQEHLISNLIRQKLIVAIDTQKNLPLPKSKKFMLFLPENEWHELGLLFYAYIIKKKGFKLFYLGQSVPLADLKKVFIIHDPDYLMTSLLSFNSETSLSDYTGMLSQEFKTKKVLIMGKYANEVTKYAPNNIQFIDTIQNFNLFTSEIEPK